MKSDSGLKGEVETIGRTLRLEQSYIHPNVELMTPDYDGVKHNNNVIYSFSQIERTKSPDGLVTCI